MNKQVSKCPGGSTSPEKELVTLRQRIKKLESRLKHTEAVRDTYACMIILAEERFHIPIRKIFRDTLKRH